MKAEGMRKRERDGKKLRKWPGGITVWGLKHSNKPKAELHSTSDVRKQPH